MNKLVKLIKDKGYNTYNFVEVSGINRSTLYSVINRNARIDTLMLIADGLEMSVSELVKELYEEKKC